MSVTLFLNPNDIPTMTAFGGNIDSDSLKPHIYTAQTTYIKKVLGRELYNKIYDDFVNNALAGDYKIIFDEFVVDMLIYFSSSIYKTFNSHKTDNNGSYKKNAENGTIVEDKAIFKQADEYRQLAASVENEFYCFIKTVTLPEYPHSTDEKDINKVIPWY